MKKNRSNNGSFESKGLIKSLLKVSIYVISLVAFLFVLLWTASYWHFEKYNEEMDGMMSFDQFEEGAES